nr:hypothetical protein [Tanacetum cinerariifolium]
MEAPAVATESSRTTSAIERSPLDFANENPSQQSTWGDEMEDQGQETMAPEVPSLENITTTGIALETGLVGKIADMGLGVIKNHCKRGNDEVDANAPPKETPADVSDLDPLSFANPQSIPKQDVVQWGVAVAEDPESENTSLPPWSGHSKAYTSQKMRHLHNDDFLGQYNINLARQVTMGLQLRLRFEQEAKLLKKYVAQVARRDQRIQARENEIKNLEALLEVEADMKKAVKAKNAELVKELENLYAPVMKGGESTELRQVFADVVSARIAKVIRELRSSSSQLKIPVYPKVRDLKDPWSFKEEILLEDAIAANVSRVKKKRKCRLVFHTHGVGFAHHAMSDGVSVSVPTVAPQCLTIMLPDTATQTETSENEASLRLLRSKSLPAMYNLDWP